MAGMLQTELKTQGQHRGHLLGTAEGKFVLIRNEGLRGLLTWPVMSISYGSFSEICPN
jgi:hypothetical protein